MAAIVFGISGMVVGIGGLVISFVVLLGNKKKSDKKDGEQEGVILSELDHIKTTTEEIKHKLEKKDEQYLELVQKLVEVEASVKSAHKRIDSLEKYHQPN
ncbi:MAG: hypothetical protein IKV81_02700 [Clostridia bacterium]|nr:hypothetical protein [Clostridia bacterium]